jgi:hypothetical protein
MGGPPVAKPELRAGSWMIILTYTVQATPVPVSFRECQGGR